MKPMFDDVVAQYKDLEPEGTDKWNPLTLDREVWHRTRLFICLSEALRQLPVAAAEAKILDVGCGVGRSTRLLLEYGVKPEKIMGLDLRPSAVAYAQSVNPAIPVRTVAGLENWPPLGTFDLCMQCTVFSSIKGADQRAALAAKMEQMVAPDGHIFWWDMTIANGFAGGDSLGPGQFFPRCSSILEHRYCMQPLIQEAVRFSLGPLARVFQRLLGHPQTHCFALLKKNQ